MKDPDPNRLMVERVAAQLGDLRQRVVFLGGAATGLLLTDPGAPSIRITKDVDVIVQIGSRKEYRDLEKELLALGFSPDHSEGAPVCRWTFEGSLIDVMPTDPGLLGFSNRWYPGALRHASEYTLPNGTQIRLVSPPYFLATKLEAFLGRGQGDYMGSHDLEDVMALLDGRATVVDEVAASATDLRRFIAQTFAGFLENDSFIGVIQGNLPPDRGGQARFPLLLDRIRTLSQLLE